MNLNQTQFYLLIYAALVIVAGAGEYFHLVPAGTFGNLLLLVFGHAAGVFSPPPTMTGGTNATTQGQEQANHQ